MPIGLGIGLNISMRGGLASGFSLDAPVLTLLTAASDNTPSWGFALVDPQENDVIRLEWDNAIPYVAQAGTADYTLTSGDIGGDYEFDFGLAQFTDGDWSWRAYHRRGGNSSEVSNTVTETLTGYDGTAPTLSSPVDETASAISGTGSVDTDEANGTLYFVVSTSATPPSAAQVKAGQIHTGAAATDSGSQAVTGTGTQSISGGFTGLTASTAYTAHYMHEDALGNQSSVSSGDGFTTSSDYAAVSVRFNSDRLNRAANLTGIADGKKGLVSFWLNMKGGDGATYHTIFENLTNGSRFGIYRWGDGNNKVRITGANSTPTNILTMESGATFTTSSGWQHFLASWDLATGQGQVYVSDTSSIAASPVLTNDTIDYNAPTDWTVGGRAAGTLFLDADIADLYINMAESLDLSVEANRRKFISAGLKPVDLGADGSTPTGTAPIVFFKNVLASWHTNVGSGGGFSVAAGGLAAGASGPSD